MPMPPEPAGTDADIAANECVRIEDVLDCEYRTLCDLSARDNEPVASRDQLMGLAFSGGGIRSATFNLGVLQALAQLKLLRQFDYLSTVSGGGYIGSWLSAWIARADQDNFKRELEEKSRTGTPVPHTPGIETVQQELSPTFSPADEPEPIRFLRAYSNYLT